MGPNSDRAGGPAVAGPFVNSAPMMGMEYVGLAQVAEILDVTPERAAELVAQDGFPERIVDSAAEPFWDLDSVEAWARDRPAG